MGDAFTVPELVVLNKLFTSKIMLPQNFILDHLRVVLGGYLYIWLK